MNLDQFPFRFKIGDLVIMKQGLENCKWDSSARPTILHVVGRRVTESSTMGRFVCQYILGGDAVGKYVVAEEFEVVATSEYAPPKPDIAPWGAPEE